MIIAYIISISTVNQNNGIKKQAEIWKDGLKSRGHTVIAYSPWDIPDWNVVDVIHIFGNGLWLIELVNSIKQYQKPIIISPIIDTSKPIWLYKLTSYLGAPKLRLFSTNYALRHIKKDITAISVRSEHEKGYLHGSYGFDNKNIYLQRLPCRLSTNNEDKTIVKKNYCLHVSTFTQKRKNVMSLMKAAVQFKFQLKIAGFAGSPVESKPFYEFAAAHDNIEILGPISEETLLTLYDEAKVFALPSFDEGVGFVALEAASRGCNIVITSIGGPKEYYNGMAQIVDPNNIASIGEGVVKAMSQPQNSILKEMVNREYCIETNIRQLEELYRNVINSHTGQHV